jgi:hypothetical protein
VTSNQIQALVAEHPRAINLISSSHIGQLPDLVEAHAEVFTLTRGECVKLYDKDGSSWMPSAVAIKRLASKAGISFTNDKDQTRKDGPHCWVGNSQATRMSPDGTTETGPACEKEFDADLQIEALRLKKKDNWVNGQKDGKRDYTQDELNTNLAQFLITGRERANTGATARAVLGLLGQPRAFKGMFSEKGDDSDIVEFLVSRVIWNTKNKMLAERMLDNLAGNTRMLFGPRPGETRLVTGNVTRMDDAPAGDEDYGTPTSSQPDPILVRKSALQDLLTKFHDALRGSNAAPSAGYVAAETLIADPNASIEALDRKLKLTKDHLESHGFKVGSE